MGVMLSCIARGHHGYKQLSSHRGQVAISTSTLPVTEIETPKAISPEVTYLQVGPLEATTCAVTASEVTTSEVTASDIAAQSQTLSVQETVVVEFTGFRFKDLPPELRAKIWRSALPGSRVVKYHRITRTIIATPILLVCREAREEALRYYMPLITGTGTITYIDPKIDVLWINDFRFFTDKLQRGIDPAILASVQHIAYPMKKLEDLIYGQNYIIRERDPIHPRAFTMHAARHFIEHIFDFTSLKTLTLVDTMTSKDEPTTKLQDFFTIPISQWPIRPNNEPFSQEDRLRLCLELYWTWGGELRWPEEVQKAWGDAMASMSEMVDEAEEQNRHAFEIEIKGLIEPASYVYVEELFVTKLGPH